MQTSRKHSALEVGVPARYKERGGGANVKLKATLPRLITRYSIKVVLL